MITGANVANPALPQSVADRFSPDYFYHTTLRDGLAWASNGDGGLQVLQADPEGLDPVREAINEVKTTMQEALDEVKTALGVAVSDSGAATFDPTLPGVEPQTGRLHPLTQLLWQLEDLFRSLGFGIVDGPELESEWYNFEALNIPA